MKPNKKLLLPETPIEVNMRGLLALSDSLDHRDWFCYKGKEWDFRKKASVIQNLPVYQVVQSQLAVGFGSLLFLKKNPKFNFKINSFPSLKDWKKLDFGVLEKEMSLDWRDIQLQAIKDNLNSIVGNSILGMASGKSEIMLALSILAANQDQNVLFVAPTDKVRTNFLDRAKKYGIKRVVPYNVVRGGTNETGLIVVANPDTWNKDCFEYDNSQLQNSMKSLITDESHNWFRPNWQMLLQTLPALHRSLGFSATSTTEKEQNSDRFSQLSEKTAFSINGVGNVIHRTPYENSSRYIDVPRLLNLKFNWNPIVAARTEKLGKSWSKVKLAINHYQERNEFILELLRALLLKDRRILVPINDRSRCVQFMKQLGPEAICWFGAANLIDHNEKPIKQEVAEIEIANGKYKLVFATDHLTEGFDLPALNVNVMTEGKDSVIITQKSGRVIRQSNVEPLIINLFDNSGIANNQARHREQALELYYEESAFEDFNTITDLIRTVPCPTTSITRI